MKERVIVVDALARAKGKRYSTLDVIGAGARCVTGYLRHLGIDADLYPFEYIVRTPEVLQEYDVLAVSAMITDVLAVRKVTSLWRKFSKGPIVIGGPIALSIDTLRRLDFDLAIVGECEIPLREIICTYKSIGAALEYIARERNILIPGVIIKNYLNSGIETSLAPWTPKEIIDSYKPAVNDLVKYDFWWACRVYVEVVRGCSNFLRPKFTSKGIKCIECGRCRSSKLSERVSCPVGIPPGCGYCSVPLVHGPARSRDKGAIVQEVKELLNIGVTRIVLSAPDFLDYGRDRLVYPEPLTNPREPPPNIDAVESLLKDLVNLPPVSEGIASISIENVKPCLINDYVAEVLGKYLKGTAVFIGVECASNDLLTRVGRPCTIEDCIKAIKLLVNAGLRPYVYLMHGIPSQTDKDLEATADFVTKLEDLGVERIVLYRFTPLPRTAFEAFPKPPAAIRRPSAKRLYEKVKEFNRRAKFKLLGKVIRVVIAAVHPRKRSKLIAYPLLHGPTTLVNGPRTLVGTIADVKIERVISDRLVEGRVISVIKRVAKPFS